MSKQPAAEGYSELKGFALPEIDHPLNRLLEGDSVTRGKLKSALTGALPKGYLPNDSLHKAAYAASLLGPAAVEADSMWASKDAGPFSIQLTSFFTTLFTDFFHKQLIDHQALQKKQEALAEQRAEEAKDLLALRAEKDLLAARVQALEARSVQLESRNAALEAENKTLVQEKARLSGKLEAGEELEIKLQRYTESVIQGSVLGGGAPSLFSRFTAAPLQQPSQSGSKGQQDPAKDVREMLKYWSRGRLWLLMTLSHCSGYLPSDRLSAICQAFKCEPYSSVSDIKAYLPCLEAALTLTPLAVSEEQAMLQAELLPWIHGLCIEDEKSTPALVIKALKTSENLSVHHLCKIIQRLTDDQLLKFESVDPLPAVKSLDQLNASQIEPYYTKVLRIYHMLGRGGSFLPQAQHKQGQLYQDLRAFQHQVEQLQPRRGKEQAAAAGPHLPNAKKA